MADVSDDAKEGFRRIEVLTGPGRRRRWSDEEKAVVVAETLKPGAVVSEVARRWQVCPQQVFTWRREARSGQLALPEPEDGGGEPAAFVPIVAGPGVPREPTPAATPAIEIVLAGAVVRVLPGVDTNLLTEGTASGADGGGVITIPAGVRGTGGYAPCRFPQGRIRVGGVGFAVVGRGRVLWRGGVPRQAERPGEDFAVGRQWYGPGVEAAAAGTFRWPAVTDGVMRLSGVEFAALFDGLDWTRVQATKGIPKPIVAA